MWVTPNHVPRAKRKRCQLCNNFNNSVITRPIALKLCMHVGTHAAMYLHVSQLECDCTCARARQRSFQISRTAGPIQITRRHTWNFNNSLLLPDALSCYNIRELASFPHPDRFLVWVFFSFFLIGNHTWRIRLCYSWKYNNLSITIRFGHSLTTMNFGNLYRNKCIY